MLTDESGLTQIPGSEAGEEHTTFHWNDIVGVYGYKRNCYAVDQIRLVFELEKGSTTEVAEDDEGFRELLLALPDSLAGFPAEKEWWEQVALSPFATNWTSYFGVPAANNIERLPEDITQTTDQRKRKQGR